MPRERTIFDVANAEAERRADEAKAKNAASLSLSGLPIEVLPRSMKGLVKLIDLDLSYCSQLQDLQLLAALPSLQSLNLSNCDQVQDLQPLAALPSLQSLNLSRCSQVQDLQPLAALLSLQSLNLRGCRQLQDLQPLAALPTLQSLDLSSCHQVQDLQPLAALLSLQSLDLGNCREVQDLQPLAALPTLQSLDLRSCRQVQDLQPLAALPSLQSLNLSGCDHVQDLQPLADLPSLQSLNLAYCDQVQDLQPLAALPNLQLLDLSDCRHLQDLESLAALPSLQSLNVTDCRRVQDLQPLAALASLQSLNLTNCSQVQDLQPLAALPSLQSLDLSCCYQVQDLKPLATLTSLQSLDLSGCSQVQDLQPLAALTTLQSLNLNGCRQVHLQSLAAFPALQSLNLSYCDQVQDLQPLAALPSLQSLDLSGCRQVRDLQALAALTTLQSLGLSYCSQVRDLQPLAALTNLESIRILGCFLDCSPASQPMVSWHSLQDLFADSLIGCPTELGSERGADNALPRIRAWQKDLLAGEAPNSQLKLFMLGNGRVGKTQISRRLLGRHFDPSVPTTHGIELDELQLAPANSDQPEIRARLWDFGGQSVYLSTHGLFLDDRAIYVISWAPQYENTDEFEQNGILMRNRPLTYWLDYVRSLAGPSAPVIVVQTQCDSETDFRPPPVPAGHGFERLMTTYSSAMQPDGIERLQLELKSAARYQLQRYGKVRLPLSWCTVAKELEGLKVQKSISYGDFESLSRTKHHTAVPSAVLQYLHRSGRVFYRPGAFGDQVIVDLDWALDGIYAVFDRKKALPLIQAQAGRFSAPLLGALVWQEYQPGEHELFISLMEQCQICFKVAKGVYIAPELLPYEAKMRSSIDQLWRDNAPPDAAAELTYSFLHEGVLRAVLCGLGIKAGEHAVYWRYGVCFYDQSAKSVARISSRFDDPTGRNPQGQIVVEATGTGSSVLVNHLVKSIQRIKIGARPEVVWTEGNLNSKVASPPDEAPETKAPFSAVAAAQIPPLQGEPRRVYVSHPWGTDSDGLLVELKTKLPDDIRLIIDKDELRPGDWISKFMQEIGRADCVVVLINEKYLQSIYCMRELLYIYESAQGQQEQFLRKVLPLTLGDLKFERAKQRADHIRYWEKEDKELDEALLGISSLSVSPADRAERLAIKDFAHRVSEILSWVADTLMPRGADLHSKGIDAVADLIKERTRPAIDKPKIDILSMN